MNKGPGPAAVDTYAIVSDYLEALLREAPADAGAGSSEVEPARTAAPAPQVSDPAPTEPAATPVQAPAAVVANAATPPLALAQGPEAEAGAASDPEPDPQAAPDDYQVLAVNSFKFAVPAAAIADIIDEPHTLQAAPAGAACGYAVAVHRGEALMVVDLQYLLLSPAARAAYRPGSGPVRLVRLRQTGWALACQRVEDVLCLPSTAVHWRTAQGKRPWLAGTAPAQRCAVLDIEALLASSRPPTAS